MVLLFKDYLHAFWILLWKAPPPNVAADAKFKKYAQAVEKCLVTFDSVHEWADFIAFLGKLLKVRHHS